MSKAVAMRKALRFPFHRQKNTMDCGPTCLRMVSEFYGKSLDQEFLNRKSAVDSEGASLLGLSEAAESIGFQTRGARISWSQLMNEVPLPCIAHWNNEHFVVIYYIKKKKSVAFGRRSEIEETVHLADPAKGLLKYSKSEFLKRWSSKAYCEEGVSLLLDPSPDFLDNKQKSETLDFSYLLDRFKVYRRHIVQLVFTILTASFISLLLPLLNQSIVDQGIGNKDLNFIVVVLLAQLTLTLGQAANGWIRSWLVLHITSRISISLVSKFLAKLMRLPISFFEENRIGEIMQTVGDHERIKSFFSGSFVNVFFSAFTFIMLSILLAGYSLTILLIFYTGNLLYALWFFYFLKKRRSLDYNRFRELSTHQTSLIHLVAGMREIKLNNCERQKRWEWERIQAKLFKVNLAGMKLNQTQEMGAVLIEQSKNIIVSFLAAGLVIEGEITLGMMVAIQSILGQLNGPIQQFVGFGNLVQEYRIGLERINKTHAQEDEEVTQQNLVKQIPKQGVIEVKNLSFAYPGKHAQKVLHDICLTIPQNKVTAIVGSSGSGKTTLFKLLMGFCQPGSGEIFLDSIPLRHYSQSQWRRGCGVVMQDGYIFSDSIARNIGLMDDRPDMVRVKRAALIANLDQVIQSFPDGFETVIGSQGVMLSSGQQQRILIARAVYKDPDYLFFDEATNALDAGNERIIMENFNRFFENRTVVMIAHRLSTVRTADQIVVLEKGSIVEKGDHQTLLDKKAVYYDLVQNQLKL